MTLVVLRGPTICNLIFFHHFTDIIHSSKDDHRDEVLFASHYIKGTWHQRECQPEDTNLGPLTEKVCLMLSFLLPSLAGTRLKVEQLEFKEALMWSAAAVTADGLIHCAVMLAPNVQLFQKGFNL